MVEGTNVTAKEYRKMQKFLLLIAGCIAIDQTLLSVVILLALLMGLQVAWKERSVSQLRVWPRHLKWLLLLLLATGYVSLHNPLVTHPFDCTFNFFYVVGQYVSVVWLVTRFGNCFAGKSRFAILRGKAVLQSRLLTKKACRSGRFLCVSLFPCACSGF